MAGGHFWSPIYASAVTGFGPMVVVRWKGGSFPMCILNLAQPMR
jgi:hypothetical protein